MSSEALATPSSQNKLGRLVGSPLFWIGFMLIAFGFHMGRAIFFGKPPSEAPKVLYRMPEFTLTDQMGKPFGSTCSKVFAAMTVNSFRITLPCLSFLSSGT